jgi:hypothetical protein
VASQLNALPAAQVRVGLKPKLVGPFFEERELAGELDLLGRGEVLEVLDPTLELDDLPFEI